MKRASAMTLLVLAMGCERFSTKLASGPDGSAGGSGGNASALASGGAHAQGAAGTGGETGTGGASSAEDAESVGGAARDGGNDAAACDETASPFVEPCVLERAVFVARGYGREGTRESPVPTINGGLARAVELGRTVVIVCNDAFDEKMTLTSVHSGMRIYGGFACPGGEAQWAREEDRPLVHPHMGGIALDITNANDVHLEELAFETEAATGPSASSVAGRIRESDGIALHRVTLTAGAGARGVDGTLTAFTMPTAASMDGNDATADDYAHYKVCACPAGDATTGGKGGRSGFGNEDGIFGWPDLGGGRGGLSGSPCDADGSGADGADASPVMPADGAETLGVLVDGLWVSAPGADGAPGGVGQGGGGGACDGLPGVAGGGGACGGCGGAGGTGGQGGGASVALLVVDSGVEIVASSLTAAQAGDGGSGAEGQLGRSGGIGGLPWGGGCPGGDGGAGAQGARGGGGAGGVSAAVMVQGAPPIVSDTALMPGAAGNPGSGASLEGNFGASGVAAEMFEAS